MRPLTAAVLVFAVIAGLADLQGWGHGYLNILILTAWYLAVDRLSPEGQRRLLVAMLWLSLLMVPLVASQFWFMPRPRGPFISANFLGGYAALNLFLAAILAQNHHAPRLCPVAFAANLFILLASQSRGALLAAIVGGLFFFGERQRLRAVAIGIVGPLCLLIICTGRVSVTDDPRWSIWRIALDAAMQRPLLGWGQNGLWISGLGVFYSVPMEWFIATGFIGLAAGIWMIVEGLRKARRLGRRAELAFLAVWLVSGLTMYSRPETAIALYTVLGMLGSVGRDVARGAGRIEHDEPFLDRGMRTGGAD